MRWSLPESHTYNVLHILSSFTSSLNIYSEPARQAAIARTAQMKAAAASASRGGRGRSSRGSKPSSKSSTSSASLRRGENMGEVVIDGVVFVFDKAGDKLVKKPTQPEASSDPSSSTSLSTSSPTSKSNPNSELSTSSTPLRTTIGGENYVRTKGGNLVKAEVAAQWKANRELRKKREKMEEMKKEKLVRLTNLGKQVGERQKAR